MPELTIGTAAARPGQIVTGWFDAVQLPSGGMDRFPVIIAQGADGPVMWLTASIHGSEHTGLIVIQRLITPDLVANLRGTLVAIPTLNPAGLRIKERNPYYLGGDPNRLFPDPVADQDHDEDRQPLPGLELAYGRLHEAIAESNASLLLDLHTAYIGSLPFAFRDPIFFHRQHGMTRSQAEALQTRVGEILDSFGFTIVNEFVSDTYVSRNLHRSVSGSVLNGIGIPAATIELGSWLHVDAHVVEACLTGLRNVMRQLGMLDGDYEPIQGIPVIRPGYPVRRHIYPHAPQSGIVHHLVRPGEQFKKGQPLVRMTDIFGQPLGEDHGLLRSEHEGFVLFWYHGVVRYQGEAIMGLAIKDKVSLVVSYPD